MNIKKIYIDKDTFYYTRWSYRRKDSSKSYLSYNNNGSTIFKKRIRYTFNFLTTIWNINTIINKHLYGSKRHNEG